MKNKYIVFFIFFIINFKTTVNAMENNTFYENLKVDNLETEIKLIQLDDFFALSGAAELIYKGWDKEAIPLNVRKKSIISRFFERFF